MHEKQLIAKELYCLRLLSGKFGYKLRRFGGFSGLVSGSSDRDLLFILSIHRGSLPRKLKGNVIICDKDIYQIVFCCTSD